MKQKKILVGAVAMALVLGTGAAAYAAEPHSPNLFAAQVKGEISTVREGILTFDETDLPEGVQFAQKVSEGGVEGEELVRSISIDDAEGALSFDETELPEGVQFAQKVSEGSVEGGNLIQSSSIGAVEGTLSFDETELPEGVQYTGQGTNSVANGVMD